MVLTMQAFHESDKQAMLQSTIGTMFEFAIQCGISQYKDNEVMKNALGVIGDLGHAYGRNMQQYFRHQSVQVILEEGLADAETESSADWAKKVRHSCLKWWRRRV
jgi:hypothetical protein